jgi:hypothetical protein
MIDSAANGPPDRSGRGTGLSYSDGRGSGTKAEIPVENPADALRREWCARQVTQAQ